MREDTCICECKDGLYAGVYMFTGIFCANSRIDHPCTHICARIRAYVSARMVYTPGCTCSRAYSVRIRV